MVSIAENPIEVKENLGTTGQLDYRSEPVQPALTVLDSSQISGYQSMFVKGVLRTFAAYTGPLEKIPYPENIKTKTTIEAADIEAFRRIYGPTDEAALSSLNASYVLHYGISYEAALQKFNGLAAKNELLTELYVPKEVAGSADAEKSSKAALDRFNALVTNNELLTALYVPTEAGTVNAYERDGNAILKCAQRTFESALVEDILRESLGIEPKRWARAKSDVDQYVAALKEKLNTGNYSDCNERTFEHIKRLAKDPDYGLVISNKDVQSVLHARKQEERKPRPDPPKSPIPESLALVKYGPITDHHSAADSKVGKAGKAETLTTYVSGPIFAGLTQEPLSPDIFEKYTSPVEIAKLAMNHNAHDPDELITILYQGLKIADIAHNVGLSRDRDPTHVKMTVVYWILKEGFVNAASRLARAGYFDDAIACADEACMPHLVESYTRAKRFRQDPFRMRLAE